MKTSGLSGADLDYWTGRADGIPASELSIVQHQRGDEMLCMKKGETYWIRYAPSTNWAQGGPLIQRERIAIVPDGNLWDGYWNAAYCGPDGQVESNAVKGEAYECETALIAAMRAYVTKSYGDEVPDEMSA